MKSKNINKTIFAFLLVFTLLFSTGFVSAFGDNELYIYSDDIEGIGKTSVDNVDVVISWDSGYPEMKVHLEFREEGDSSWTDVTGSEYWIDNPWDYSASIDDQLDPGTSYELRAVAEEYKDNNGYGFTAIDPLESNIQTFETEIDYDYPLVLAPEISEIGENSAKFSSEVDDMGSADELEVYFQYCDDSECYDTQLSGEYTETLTSPGSFSYTPDDLEAGTDYEVEAYADDLENNEKSSSTGTSFETTSAEKPSISVLSPQDITSNSAKLRGELDDMGTYDSVDVRFAYRESDSAEWITISDSETTLNSPDTYSYEYSELDPDTEYEYTFGYYDEEDSDWKVSVDEKTFTTSAEEEASVNLRSPEEVETNSADLRADYDLGQEDEVEIYFEYQKEGTGDWNEVGNEVITSDSGTYTYNVTGLDSDTDYEYRVYMVGNTTTYGGIETESFTTRTAESPEIETLTAENIRENSANLRAELISVNEDKIGIYFQYREEGTSDWDSMDSFDIENPEEGEEYVREVENLNPSTDYEYRAVVSSYDLDASYPGNIETFSTKAPPWEDTEKQRINSEQEFEELIDNLDPDSKYEFRAVMEADGETKRGSVSDFTTDLVPPQINREIADFSLNYESEREINLDDYYEYYDSYTLKIDDETISNSKTLVNDDIDPVLDINLSSDSILFTSHEIEEDYEAEIILYNEEGTETDKFNIEIKAGFLESIVDSLTGIFPDSDDLSGGQKAGYVLVSMLVISIIMVAIGTTTGGVSKGILILTGILNFLALIFYIAIGYISLGILIALILIAIAVISFKIKGSGGE